MAEERVPPDSGSKTHRRTRTAEVADAIGENADKIARLSPQQALTLVAIAALAFICAMQAYQVYIYQQALTQMNHEVKESVQAQMRESNSREEINRMHCSAEAEKVRAETEKVRLDSRETVKVIVTAFLTEGEKNREFQARENEKFRKEVLMKGKCD